MSKKRGQATIFMVAALVILIIGSLYFYAQRASEEDITLIKPEAAPVKNFIDNCINNVAKDAIILIGLTGGYTSFPDSIESNPRSYLQLGPISNVKNPFWWYDGISNIPPETFITSQIEDYVATNLDACINEFSDFQEFDVRKLGNIKVKATLNENDVTVDVNYPLLLTSRLNQTTIRLENFKETIGIRLKKVYEAARDIMEAENRDFFLEFKTIDLISLDEDIPTTDIEVTCEERAWNIEEVKNKLKRLLNANLPYINIVGSEFNENVFVPNPFGEDIYKNSYFNSHYRWLITDKSYSGLKISFDYDNWPMQFYARPSKDGFLKSNAQQGQDLLKFLCLHIWHFTYDVIYPVRVVITDNADGFSPYQFIFAFKVSVDHNQPRRENFAATLFEQADIADQEEYCNDLANEITVFTTSNSTDEDIAHVNLTYTCGIFTCNIGETDWISFGAAAALTTRFPYCVSGILRGNKEGFEESQMFIQTETPGTYTLYLNPIKEFTNYEVVKHDSDNPSFSKNLEKDETAYIRIKSTTSSFETFGLYPSEKAIPIKLLNSDNQYEIIIYLSDDKDTIGGYQSTWAVSANQVADSDKIIFHVVENKQDDNFEFISNLKTHSKNIPQPELR